MQVNGLTNPDRLAVGQQLRLPAEGDARVLAAAYRDAVDVPVIAANTVESELATDDVETVAASNEQATQALAADPADYSVAADNTVEIQASETLGHLSEWAGTSVQTLRSANGMRANQSLIVGQRFKLPAQVAGEQFELRRRQFHLAAQESFFRQYRIADVNRHQLAANETIDVLARQRYAVPLWLLRQYNPDLDFARVRVGQTIVFPIVARVDGA